MKNPYKAVLTSLALIIILAVNSQSFAQDRSVYPIGQVIEIEGTAWFKGKNNKRKARKEDPVYLNNVIETDKGSKLLILFIDDTQIILAENSELLINEFIFDPYDPEENEGDFEISKGAFHWLSGMLSKRERPQVKITTAIGSIGIRGTQFWAGDIMDGYGVFVQDGTVNFKGNWGNVEMRQDEGIFIKPLSQETPRNDFWHSQNREHALIRTTLLREAEIARTLAREREKNIRRRNDYHGYIWPHKPNPYSPRYRVDPENFFTDEFEEMRQRN